MPGIRINNIIKRSISLSPTVNQWAEEMAETRGFGTNFSAFIADLVRRAQEGESDALGSKLVDAINSMPAAMNDATVTPGTEKQFEKFANALKGHASGATTSYRRAKSKGESGSATGSRPKQGRRAGRKNTGAQAQGRI